MRKIRCCRGCGVRDEKDRYESQDGPFMCEPCDSVTTKVLLRIAVLFRQTKYFHLADLLARMCQ